VNLAPLLPAMIGDRARLQDALATILGDAVRSSASNSRVQLTVDQRDTKLVIDMQGIGRPESSLRSAAGARVIQVHGGTVEQHEQGVTVMLPLESRGQSSVVG
jgi:signal transduction histidine kinase